MARTLKYRARTNGLVALLRESDPEDTPPQPPGQTPGTPKEPPESPKSGPDAPVREPGPAPPKKYG